MNKSFFFFVLEEVPVLGLTSYHGVVEERPDWLPTTTSWNKCYFVITHMKPGCDSLAKAAWRTDLSPEALEGWARSMFKHCVKHVASKAWPDSSAERTFHCSRSGLMCWCSIRPWRQLTWFLHTKPNMREDHFPPKTHLLYSFSWHKLSSQRPDTILIFKFAHHAYYLFYNLKDEMEKKYYHSYFFAQIII